MGYDKYEATAAGQRWGTASGEITIGANEHVRATIENPAGSGKVVRIEKFVVTQNVGYALANFFINPTTGLPTTVRTGGNQKIGHPGTAKAIVKIDKGLTALSGGSDTDLDALFPPGREIHDEPMEIPPGVTVGINVPVGLLGTGKASLTVYWTERDA